MTKVYWGSPDKEKSGELLAFVNYTRPAGRKLGTWKPRERFYTPHAKVRFVHPRGEVEEIYVRATQIRLQTAKG